MNLKSLRTLVAVGLFALAGQGWATPSVPKDGNTTWQQLTNIQWSTDNGATWGNSALVVGEKVEFKFTMFKAEDGNHYADLLKAWIDWNGDQQFATDGSETLFSAVSVVNSVKNPHTDVVIDKTISFTTGPVTLMDSMVGDHFLLARVTCTDAFMSVYEPSVGKKYSWDDQWASWATTNNNNLYKQYMSPTASYYQGNSELVKLSIYKTPEPGTLALFAAAMVGVGLRRKPAARA